MDRSNEIRDLQGHTRNGSLLAMRNLHCEQNCGLWATADRNLSTPWRASSRQPCVWCMLGRAITQRRTTPSPPRRRRPPLGRRRWLRAAGSGGDRPKQRMIREMVLSPTFASCHFTFRRRRRRGQSAFYSTFLFQLHVSCVARQQLRLTWIGRWMQICFHQTVVNNHNTGDWGWFEGHRQSIPGRKEGSALSSVNCERW